MTSARAGLLITASLLAAGCAPEPPLEVVSLEALVAREDVGTWFRHGVPDTVAYDVTYLVKPHAGASASQRDGPPRSPAPYETKPYHYGDVRIGPHVFRKRTGLDSTHVAVVIIDKGIKQMSGVRTVGKARASAATLTLGYVDVGRRMLVREEVIIAE